MVSGDRQLYVDFLCHALSILSVPPSRGRRGPSARWMNGWTDRRVGWLTLPGREFLICCPFPSYFCGGDRVPFWNSDLPKVTELRPRRDRSPVLSPLFPTPPPAGGFSLSLLLKTGQGVTKHQRSGRGMRLGPWVDMGRVQAPNLASLNRGSAGGVALGSLLHQPPGLVDADKGISLFKVTCSPVMTAMCVHRRLRK